MPDPLFSVPKIDPSTTDLGDVGQSLEGQGGFGGSSFAQAPAQKKRFDFARALAFAGGLGPNVIAAETARGQAQAKRQAAERASVIKTADAAIKDQLDIINKTSDDLKNRLLTKKMKEEDLPRVLKNTTAAAAFVGEQVMLSLVAAGIPENVARSKVIVLGSALDRLDTQRRLVQTPEGAGAAKAQQRIAELSTGLDRPLTPEDRRQEFTPPQSPLAKLQSDMKAALAAGDTVAANQIQKQIIRQTEAPEKIRDRELRIKSLIGQGLSRDDATNITDGVVELQLNSLTGQPQIVNKATKAVEVLNVKPPGSRVSQPRQLVPDRSIFDDLDNVGALPFFAEGLSRTFGQFIDDANTPEITQARTRLKLLREEIVDALASSGRPPIVEQQRILESYPSMGPLESPIRAKSMMDATRGLLERVRDADVNYGNNPNNSLKLRQESLGRAKRIAGVLLQIGTPGETRQKGKFIVNPTTGERRKLNPQTGEYEPVP